MITHWHVCIGGFLQHRGQFSGMQVLWQRLRQEHHSPSTCVELCSWNDNWAYIAEWIWRMRPSRGLPEVRVYAYSWGAGYGAIRLAEELQDRSIPVRCMVLADPIFRSRLVSFCWLSMLRWLVPPIVVPSNVEEVYWFYQRLNRPCASPLVALDPDCTRIHGGVEAHATHQRMDDLAAFHARSLAVSER